MSTIGGKGIYGLGHQTILPQVNDATAPTLAFGDGDSGIYESSDDELMVTIEGANAFKFIGNNFESQRGSKPTIRGIAASDISPVFIPELNDPDTGIGKAAENQLSLIAGGVEKFRLTPSGGTISIVCNENQVVCNENEVVFT